jgi:uncharacterized protein (TIGR02722 family)
MDLTLRRLIMSKQVLGLLLLSVFLILSCAKSVSRVASDSVTDLSGKWNDTDSRLVATEMIEDCLSRPWYQSKYVSANIIPTVIVGQVRNKSHEHISVETFIKDMERTLINSGKVEFVASKAQREELRDEVGSQMGNATDQTIAEKGQEIGADLMLVGSINSIVDQEGNQSVLFYQVDLELIEVETHKKLWIGNKKIKKLVDKNSLKL